ncbi:hypothetical protein [Burkholderia lata]|nr:hypothetical protein [Burkholderia lata]
MAEIDAKRAMAGEFALGDGATLQERIMGAANGCGTGDRRAL